MAKDMSNGFVPLAEGWERRGFHLGLGIGVATGFVTVGVIGAASRLEYTAVGSAVNLASRLCAEALHAEVLVDERTKDLIATFTAPSQLHRREPLALKGFPQPVAHFALAP